MFRIDSRSNRYGYHGNKSETKQQATRTMVVYTAFSQNVSTLYKTTLCSKSTVFLAVTTFWAFFLPLLIAYRSQGKLK